MNKRLTDALESEKKARLNVDRQPPPTTPANQGPEDQGQELDSDPATLELMDQWAAEEQARLELEERLAATSEAVGVTLADPEITLRVKGGEMKFVGQLKKYDGTNYVILSERLGMLTVRADRFDCISSNCPTQAN